MGKISVPVSNTTEPTNEVVSGDTLLDIEIVRPTTDALLEDDLSITNEALRLMPLKKFMGLDVMNMEHDKKLKDIVEWAKDKGVKNRNQFWAKLREIEYKLGVIDGSEAKVSKIHEYTRIDSQIKGLVNRLGAIEDGN